MVKKNKNHLIRVTAICLKGFINWLAKLICSDKLFLNNREFVGTLQPETAGNKDDSGLKNSVELLISG